MDIRDRFSGLKMSIHHPARKAWVITPDDDNDVTDYCRYLRCESAGVLRLTLREMTPGTYIDLNVLENEHLAVAAKRIWATATTVTRIVGLE